ncbi:FadR/GntR family transcriptional regulator [Roseateles sp. LKC17W]|uniref:FadR/GntR family transcriptional regulator n=1 Tax=Pelomonas margarita TaxID=3299031 RepID=A0ABW7FCK9_9BURK
MNSNAPSPASARPPSLSQRVVDGLSERIASGALKPGDRVPTEPVLMQEFGVSRSVVREAVSRLQASGLLRTQQGVGSFVLAPQVRLPSLQQAAGAELKLQQKLAMLELRLSLEPEAAALAAQRRTPEQLRAMEQALDDFDTQHTTGEGTAEADFRFHELIAQATGNEYFSHVLRTLGNATMPRQAAARRTSTSTSATKAARFGESSPELRPGKEITAQEHWAVLEAIRRGDAAGARAAMFMHLNNSRERMKTASR